MSFHRPVGVMLGILLTLGSAGLAHAQVTTGTILGTVQDPTGAPVPNAKITVTETSKNTTLAYETDGTGSYNAPFLIPGTYSVTVENAGFKKQVRPNITLRIDDKLRVDFNLQVGDVAESVTISDSVSLLKSDSAELGTVITETPVRELPLNGRNFAQLVYLSPGVTPGQSGENLSGASTFNPRGASNFNALGHQANANAWLLDGIDNNEWTFNTVIITPTIESVREFKVLTGAYSAEFGRGAGVVSVSTKSGSNEFHGNVFWFLRNANLDARPYFLAPSVKKPAFRRNQMGLAASGPLWIPKAYNGRSRTFWFFDYAGNRETRGTPYVNTVPDALQRVGNFAQYTNTSGVLIPIYNPLTTRRNPNFNSGLPESPTNPQFLRDPFAGNIVPGGVINPVGRNVASIYPLPNAAGNFNNYNAVVNRVVNDNAYTGRLDHNFGMKNSAFFRYNYNSFSLDAPQGQANCCLPTPADAASRFELGPFVAGIQNTRLTTYGAAFTDTHAFQPNLLNEFRLGFGVTNPSTFQSDFGKRAAQSLGIGGINVSEFTTGLPNINLTNYTGLSGGPAFLPVNPKQTNYQLDENIFWTAGRHTVKFGYHVVKRLPSPFTNTDTRGTLNFNNNFTNDVTQPSRQAGTGIATLLMGYTTGASRGFLLEPYYLTVWDHGTFIQDDIKVSKRLTLNVGMRWDIFTPEVEERNRITNFDYTNLRLVYAGEGGTTRQAGRRTHYGNFGPRFGMAWDFLGDGKTVLRAGYGLSYFPVQASASNIIGQQVPYTISQNVQPEQFPVDMSRVPQIQNIFPGVTPVKPMTTAELNAANPRIIAQNWENNTPYAQTWTLNLQRQFTDTIVLEVGYAGSRGIFLPMGLNPNEVQPGLGTLAARRLIQPLSNMNNILGIENINSSTYHGLATKLEKRFSQGLMGMFSYTWSKALDYGGSVASGGGAVGGPRTVTCIKCSRGPAGFDAKHRAVGNLVYFLPFGKGQKYLNDAPGIVNAVLGGWQMNAIVTLTTGRPFTVNQQNGVNNGAPSWPNRIGPGTLDNPDRALWFNPRDFVSTAPNTFGNTARGTLYAPGNNNFDFSFVKNNKIANEKLNLQFRFEMYNAFNTPYFGFPNQNFDAPTAGVITSTIGDNRSLQMALKVEW